MRIIGRLAKIDLPALGLYGLTAKVDTGARSSSLHVEDIREEVRDGQTYLVFQPLDKKHPEMALSQYRRIVVRSSFGEKEERYAVDLLVKRGNNAVMTLCTLTNRKLNRTKILLGRRFLKTGKYLMDVSISVKKHKQ